MAFNASQNNQNAKNAAPQDKNQAEQRNAEKQGNAAGSNAGKQERREEEDRPRAAAAPKQNETAKAGK